MPRYDHRCRACGETFEVTRSIHDLDQPVPCPAGHSDTVRLLRTVAVTGVAGSSSSSSRASGPAPSSGGGCCGGGCCA